MDQRRTPRGLFVGVLAIGLIVLIALFFAARSPVAQTSGAIATPITITETATVGTNASASGSPSITAATATAVAAAGKEPPACSFPLAQTTTAGLQPENYTFSEPQVVLTTTHPVEIYQWLPDNQRVLIGQEPALGQSVALFEPQTAKSKFLVRVGRLPMVPQSGCRA